MKHFHSSIMLHIVILALITSASSSIAFEHFLSGTIFLTFDPVSSSQMQRHSDGSISLPNGLYALDIALAKFNVRQLTPVFSFDPISLRNKEFHALGMNRFYLVHFPKPFSTEEQIRQLCDDLSRIPGIAEAAPCPIRRVQYTPNDWQLYRSSNVQMITDYYDSLRLRRAWDYGKGDSTILAISIDTGVDYNHEDLFGSIRVNSAEDINHDGRFTSADNNGVDNDGNGFVDDIIGYDFVSHSAAELGGTTLPGEDYGPRDNNPMDFETHGTHVAGILAAKTDNRIGVNSAGFNIRTICVRGGCGIINSEGHTDGSGSDDDFIAGIQYSVNRGARILTLSYGSFDTPTAAYTTALQYARNNNCLVFAAAGNQHGATRFYPAAAENVIAVSALSPAFELHSASNYGNWIDLCAFGESIWSTLIQNAVHTDGYIQYTGTSMASPMAASVAALILSRNPTLTVNQLESLIFSTGINLDRYNPTKVGMMGHGLVNPFADLHVIALTTPNGGERYSPGLTLPIRWSTNNMTGNITIDINRNYPNGAWEQIASSVVNNGVYNWMITGAVSNNCRLRLRSVAMTPQIGDTSHANFIIASPLELNNRTAQNGYSDSYYKLTPTSASWTVVGCRVEISNRTHYLFGFRDSLFTQSLDTSRGNSTDFLVADYHHTALSSVYYKVSPGNVLYGSNYRVQGDATPDTLRPGMASALQTWPANSVVKIWNLFLPAGTTHTIQLDQTGGINLGMYLFGSQGSSYYADIAKRLERYAPDNLASKQIQFTPTVSDWYGLVILCDNDSSGTYTLSIPGVMLSSPNGGESWAVGTTNTIQWSAGAVLANLTMEVNRNYPTGSWEYIGITGSNVGSYSWTVTQPASGHARIRISVMQGTQQISDISDGDFIITQTVGDLSSGSALGGNGQTSYFKFSQTQNYWSVVGLHSPSGSDYDLQLTSDSTYSTTLATCSTIDSTDFIVSDHNHTQMGYFYPKVTRYSGTGTFNIQYESGSDLLQSGSRIISAFEASRIARVWDVFLDAGTHTFRCDRIAGTGDLGMALYRSNGAAYYAGKQAAVATSSTFNDAKSFSYTAPIADYYGLVVYKNTSDAAACSLFVDVAPPTITLTVPTGNEYYPYSADVNITWNSSDIVGNVAIELTRNYYSNSTWVPIAANVANNGYYRWMTTGPETGMARIRVRSIGMVPVRGDTCDTNFSIAYPSIGVLTNNLSIARQGGDYIFYSYNQTPAQWSAVGIRSTTGTDYDLSVWSDNIFTNAVAGSNLTVPVDFVAMDNHHTVTGTYYNRMKRYSGTGSFSIEWCAGDSNVLAPPCNVSGNWLAFDVVKMWNVNLTGGIQYTFKVLRTSGAAVFGIKLFQSSGESYSVGCEQAVAGAEFTTSDSVSVTYTPTSNDIYGLALYANNESNSGFTVSVDEPPRFVITSPGSTDSWTYNTTGDITWNSVHITGNVNIEINRHYPWGNWTAIASNITNNNTYRWNVTGPGTQNARIRITTVSMTTVVCDTSSSDFTIIAPPSLSFISPVTTTICSIGTTQGIRWSSQNLEGNLVILLNRNTPTGIWDTVLSNVSNTGTTNWLVTGPETSHAQMKISTLSMWPMVVAYSDSPLTIVQPHFVSITLPNGGETWTIGSSRMIQWTALGINGNLTIELNRNYPTGIWDTLFANASNTGNIQWTVSGATTRSARIRISSISNLAIGDTSDTCFAIIGSTLPKSPTNLSVARYQATDTLQLSWSQVTLDTLNQPITVTGYNIYHTAVSDTTTNPYRTTGWLLLGTSTDASFFIPDALTTAGQRRFYQIKASAGTP